MNLFLGAYTGEQITALILVPTLSAALMFLIVVLLFARPHGTAIVTAQVYLGKAEKLLNARTLSNKDCKRLSVYLGKAQFGIESGQDRQSVDITPLVGYLSEATKIAYALVAAERKDDKFLEMIRERVEKSRDYLSEKCGVEKLTSSNFKIASKSQKNAAAQKYLDSLDK